MHDRDLRFDPFASRFHAAPYDVMAEYRQQAAVQWGVPASVHDPDGAWYVLAYDEAEAALRDPRLGRDRRALIASEQGLDPPEPGSFLDLAQHWVLFRDPPAHTRLRRVLNAGFTARRIEALRPAIAQIADDLLARNVRGRDRFDLIAAFAYPFPVHVISRMLGLPERDWEQLREWSSALARGLDFEAEPNPEVERAAAAAARAFQEYLGDVIEERRRRSTDDVISLLLAEDAADALPPDALLSNVIFLFLAGHETTVNLIASGTSLLLQHPEQLQALVEGRAGIPDAVEEMLRFESPVRFTMRVALDGVDTGGQTIQRAQDVVIGLGGANRDPARFPEPDRFDVTRPTSRNLAFGAGAHMCLGSRLARIEAEIAFERLLPLLPSLALAEEPTWKPIVFLRSLERLELERR